MSDATNVANAIAAMAVAHVMVASPSPATAAATNRLTAHAAAAWPLVWTADMTSAIAARHGSARNASVVMYQRDREELAPLSHWSTNLAAWRRNMRA